MLRNSQAAILKLRDDLPFLPFKQPAHLSMRKRHVSALCKSRSTDYRGLRRSGTKNRVSVYHDAPLMTPTARYFLNQLAINAPSTYLHRGCFK